MRGDRLKIIPSGVYLYLLGFVCYGAEIESGLRQGSSIKISVSILGFSEVMVE